MGHVNLLFLGITLVFLILLSGFFSSSETGMMSLNRYRLRHKAREGHRAAQRVQKLLERPDRLLGIILIGNTFANILASSVATIMAIRILGETGIFLATIVLTLIILIFAEIAPKTVAAIYPEKLSFFVSFPLWLLLRILYPIVWLATSIANGILRLMRIQVKKKYIAEKLNKEELRTVVHESVGSIAADKDQDAHKDMLLSVLDLTDMAVEDVMIPRNEVVGLDLNQNMANVLKQLISSKHSLLPVYYGSIEKVVGIFDVRRALQLMSKNRLTKRMIVKATQQPYFIPEGTALNTQLQKFRDSNKRLALVVDEYGDILGLVTVKDILEEIVGELDSSVATKQRLIYPQADGSYIVSGSVSIRDLNKHMGWKLPTKGPKTLSGLIVEKLEAIPEANVSLLIERYRIEVLQVEGNKVIQARIISNSNQ